MNDYDQDFKCSGTCGRTVRKEGIYIRLLQQPESPASGDTIIVVCGQCLSGKSKYEGIVDLSRQQTHVQLGYY